MKRFYPAGELPYSRLMQRTHRLGQQELAGERASGATQSYFAAQNKASWSGKPPWCGLRDPWRARCLRGSAGALPVRLIQFAPVRLVLGLITLLLGHPAYACDFEDACTALNSTSARPAELCGANGERTAREGGDEWTWTDDEGTMCHCWRDQCGLDRSRRLRPKGHLPLLQVAPAFAMSFIPFPDRVKDDIGNLGVNFGIEAKLHADLGVVAPYADGFLSFLQNDLVYTARAGVVFAEGPGGRSTMDLTTYVGTTYTGTEQIEHYESYPGKELPVIYGLTLGASIHGLREAIRESLGGDSLPEQRRPATTIATIEVGFGVLAGQIEFLAAPMIEVTTLRVGARWRFQYGFAFGRHVLYFNVSGDHLFGTDAETPLRHLVLMSIGITSGIGVSTSSN